MGNLTTTLCLLFAYINVTHTYKASEEMSIKINNVKFNAIPQYARLYYLLSFFIRIVVNMITLHYHQESTLFKKDYERNNWILLNMNNEKLGLA